MPPPPYRAPVLQGQAPVPRRAHIDMDTWRTVTPELYDIFVVIQTVTLPWKLKLSDPACVAINLKYCARYVVSFQCVLINLHLPNK